MLVMCCQWCTLGHLDRVVFHPSINLSLSLSLCQFLPPTSNTTINWQDMWRSVSSCLLFVCFILGSTTSSSTLQNEAELGDDDVFTVRAFVLLPLFNASLFYQPLTYFPTYKWRNPIKNKQQKFPQHPKINRKKKLYLDFLKLHLILSLIFLLS